MPDPPVPERIAWAVQVLSPAPGQHLLELGCGPGVAVRLVCDAVAAAGGGAGGRVTAVDRSQTALARTARRNADHLAAGRLMLLRAELAELAEPAAGPADLGPGFDVPFDAAFAVDVNVFWTRPAGPLVAAVLDRLRPGAPLHLVYGAPGPSPGQTSRAREAIIAGAQGLGVRVDVLEAPAPGLLGLTLRRS